jgi:Protein of unknown function (DUF2950)
MKGNQLIQRYFFVSMISAGLVGAIAPAALAQAAPGQTTFASASAAAAALVAACKSGDQDELLKILGPEGKDLISSGDPVADKKSQEGFAKNYAVKHRLTSEAQGFETLIVGANDWPMPIPIVRDGERWYFDSARGHDEVIDRRIGANELGAIAVCEGYVEAQHMYAAKGHDGLPAGLYAQRLVSTEGKHDGLYWKPGPGEPESPMGPAVAAAAGEGYTGAADPYHGYYYRLLKEQGPDAEGGAKSYLVDGKLSGGFALLAYTATYGNTGIMTFLVDKDGVVLQKDLGDDTANVAKGITAYNPTSDWVAAADTN